MESVIVKHNFMEILSCDIMSSETSLLLIDKMWKIIRVVCFVKKKGQSSLAKVNRFVWIILQSDFVSLVEHFC